MYALYVDLGKMARKNDVKVNSYGTPPIFVCVLFFVLVVPSAPTIVVFMIVMLFVDHSDDVDDNEQR